MVPCDFAWGGGVRASHTALSARPPVRPSARPPVRPSASAGREQRPTAARPASIAAPGSARRPEDDPSPVPRPVATGSPTSTFRVDWPPQWNPPLETKKGTTGCLSLIVGSEWFGRQGVSSHFVSKGTEGSTSKPPSACFIVLHSIWQGWLQKMLEQAGSDTCTSKEPKASKGEKKEGRSIQAGLLTNQQTKRSSHQLVGGYPNISRRCRIWSVNGMFKRPKIRQSGNYTNTFKRGLAKPWSLGCPGLLRCPA